MSGHIRKPGVGRDLAVPRANNHTTPGDFVAVAYNAQGGFVGIAPTFGCASVDAAREFAISFFRDDCGIDFDHLVLSSVIDIAHAKESHSEN